jgi:SAM-dependent methyltransferase
MESHSAMAFRLWRVLRSVPGVTQTRVALNKLLSLAKFSSEYRRFQRLARDTPSRFVLHWSDRLRCSNDRTETTNFDRHYVYHTAWAARVLAATRPCEHVDISSSVYFCGMVSAFIPVTFYDYRPAALQLEGLDSRPADLMALPFDDASVASLSCMHVIEHIGLGRYGDALDPEGDLRAMAELSRVLAPGGNLLLVAPVGRPRIQFNAHRIYAYRQIVERFAGLDLVDFSLVPDDGSDDGLIRAATEEVADAQHYGCGCFWFRRPA